MPRYDILFFDLDGTLLSPDHKTVSPGNQAALRAARAAGVRLAIATGRCLSIVSPEALALGLADYAVTSNGAAVYDLRAERQIYHDPFPPREAALACGIIERYIDFYELFADGNVLLVRTPRAEAAGQAMPPWGKFYLERRGGMPPMTDIQSYLAKGAPGLEKINMIELPPDTLLRMQDELKAAELFDLSSSMGYGGLEVVPRACTKGSAIRWLCGELGIPLARCAAFGDSGNDRDMLAAAGCGVAMENAPDELKAAADFVAPPYDEDGVARFIEQYVL